MDIFSLFDILSKKFNNIKINYYNILDDYYIYYNNKTIVSSNGIKIMIDWCSKNNINDVNDYIINVITNDIKLIINFCGVKK